MAISDPTERVAQPRRSFKQILNSYFYWTYPRGSFPLRRDGDADPAVHLRHAAPVGLRRQAAR